jgi:hypothetical protein
VVCRTDWSLDARKCERQFEDPSDQTYTVPVFGAPQAGAVLDGLNWTPQAEDYYGRLEFLPVALLRELECE